MTLTISPFKFDVPPAAIADLHARLDAARWPDGVAGDTAASYGIGLDTMRELVAYWRHEFDWSAAQRRLNALPQFQVDLDGLPLHFIHARSPHAEARPLILSHGWPGSIVEFLELIPRLTEPEKFGGSPADAFHVVAPSLQGYGGSALGDVGGISPLKIAERQVRLMALLDYPRYIAQGGDWGSLIAHTMATIDPDHCTGLHLNLVTPIPPRDVAEPMALVREHEKAWLSATAQHVADGSGYYQIQRTRPQTLAYALTDSPLGWCAWVAEKFHGWSDCERDGKRDIRNAVSWDAMLTNISLYWYTGTIGSAIRLYAEQARQEKAPRQPRPVTVPTGVAIYPAEIFRSPKAWVERQYPLVHWTEAAQGGHFAAMEQPQAFAEDLWRFGRTLDGLVGPARA